jgi:4-hydroxybenzoate-CoA ligase
VVYGTSGKPVPGYELRWSTRTAPRSGPARWANCWCAARPRPNGYWNKRDKSRATFEGKWTRTGDKYEITPEEGRFHVYCGRTDDMFKVSGIWVSPFEVEQALVAIPACWRRRGGPKRDEDGLEKPKAFVVLKDGAGRKVVRAR